MAREIVWSLFLSSFFFALPCTALLFVSIWFPTSNLYCSIQSIDSRRNLDANKTKYRVSIATWRQPGVDRSLVRCQHKQCNCKMQLLSRRSTVDPLSVVRCDELRCLVSSPGVVLNFNLVTNAAVNTSINNIFHRISFPNNYFALRLSVSGFFYPLF